MQVLHALHSLNRWSNHRRSGLRPIRLFSFLKELKIFVLQRFHIPIIILLVAVCFLKF